MPKISSFTDLNAWKHAHQLALLIYQITDSFPSKEKFYLTDQIRRAAISITSNIAEGFSRKTSKDKPHFYYISKGSLTELQNQLLLARDIGYINQPTFQTSATQTIIVGKLLTGLIKSLRTTNQ